jgi:hypothetical protein
MQLAETKWQATGGALVPEKSQQQQQQQPEKSFWYIIRNEWKMGHWSYASKQSYTSIIHVTDCKGCSRTPRCR